MALITQALSVPENILYQVVNRFQGSWLTSTSVFVDSGLAYGQTVSPHIASHTNSIHLFSNIVNAGWIAWDALELFSAFQTKEVSLLATLRSSSSMSLARMTHISGAILSIGAAFTVVKSIYHWASSPKEVPQDWRDKISEEDRDFFSLKFEHPRMKSLSQTIYLTRIVINVAIACFSPEKALLCGMNAAGLAYSLLKTTQVRWLKLTRLYKFLKPTISEIYSLLIQEGQEGIQCKKLAYSYILPLLPNPIAESKCVICLNDNPSTGFSPSSPFHLACLANYIYSKSGNIGTHATASYTKYDGVYSAELEIPESDLPVCPVSKNHPSSHYVEAQFTDRYKGRFVTTVNVIPDPSVPSAPPPPLLSERVLRRLGTVYSAFQAGLVTLQHRHHELAGKIISIQKVLSLFDMGLLLQNYYQLYCTLYEQTVSKMVKLNTPQNQVDEAQTSYDAATLHAATLANEIEEAIQTGSITEQSLRVIAGETITMETFLVPNNNAMELLKQHNLARKTIQTAMKSRMIALQAQAAARASLEAQYHRSLYIKMGLGIAAVTAVSAISVNLWNRALVPFNVVELLKRVIKPADFSNMKISSSVPWLSRATECILVSRLIVNFVLAYFSAHRRTYLTTALLQTFTLTRLAQLPWIALPPENGCN